jgi:hypothetical protein
MHVKIIYFRLPFEENNDFGDGCDEQLLWNGIPTNKVSIDTFFGDRREDMNANARQEQSV